MICVDGYMGSIVSTSDESIHLNEDYFSWDN